VVDIHDAAEWTDMDIEHLNAVAESGYSIEDTAHPACRGEAIDLIGVKRHGPSS
jgi:hypothetical protein